MLRISPWKTDLLQCTVPAIVELWLPCNMQFLPPLTLHPNIQLGHEMEIKLNHLIIHLWQVLAQSIVPCLFLNPTTEQKAPHCNKHNILAAVVERCWRMVVLGRGLFTYFISFSFILIWMSSFFQINWNICTNMKWNYRHVFCTFFYLRNRTFFCL